MALIDSPQRLLILLVTLVVLVVVFFIWALAITIVHLQSTDTISASTEIPKPLKDDCSVLILGAGFAGSYAAYVLGPKFGKKVCVVEKLSRVGGRIFDVFQFEGGPKSGLGALRVTSTQKSMNALAAELGVKFQIAHEHELFKVGQVRGEHFFNESKAPIGNRVCKKKFFHKNLSESHCEDPEHKYDADTAMLRKLLDTFDKNKTTILNHPDWINYVISLLQDEGLAFMREMIKFNSLFSSVSARGMLEFLTVEVLGLSLDPQRQYPEGGMSQFIEKMLAKANASGVQILLSEEVLDITTDLDDSTALFTVMTKNYVFKSETVLCSIDPRAFNYLTGNVAEKIQKMHQFQMIKPVPVAIVNTWWPNHWWKDSKYGKGMNLSRVVSHGNTFSVMEIPTFPYGIDQKLTRSVYCDSEISVNTWRTLLANVSRERIVAYGAEEFPKLTDEVVNSLQQVFSDITVPRPLLLHGTLHENAWHFQHPQSNLSNSDILKWSVHPLSPKKFALIGEAFNLDYAAWADAALKQTMQVLIKYFNINFTCINDTGSPACPTLPAPIFAHINWSTINVIPGLTMH